MDSPIWAVHFVLPNEINNLLSKEAEGAFMAIGSKVELSQEVAEALASNQPVVALESTIISHGMPYPKNVETALMVEQIVREQGAIPATIAVIGGKPKAGLTKEEITYLGKKGLAVPKASRRDLPVLVARGQDGATTVAATMIIAEMANIPVFCTGGIGGVHRNAETTMDISADLEELAQNGVLVVCAGAKSILDLGLTLEYLETKGVPVLGYQTDELPAFYTRQSGFKVDYKINSAQEMAAVFQAKDKLGLVGGIVVANPIPEEHSMDHTYINSIIEQALVDAHTKGIKGKDTTPFLLDAIQKNTDGKSLAANIQLVFNNAKLAAQIAVEYGKLQNV